MRAMVVVGGGECGARAAQALREAGWNGPITLVAAEHLAPYERPPLSKAAMTADEHPAPTTICDDDAMRSTGIEFVAGVAATDLDRVAHQVVLADGRRLDYERLLLATGATARRLPFGDPSGNSVHYLRSHADALVLRDRLQPGAAVGVIGGGFIGLEVASSASTRGCTVTVLEAAPQVMGRVVPAEIAERAANRHRAAGVELRCGVGVHSLHEHDDTVTVELADGTSWDFDTVVAGIGAVPDTAVAEKAGLDVQNGVCVDDRLTTSDPDVFAAGDCCSFPHPIYDGRRIRLESWRNAQDQGNAAAANMLGADEPFATVPWFWSDQYELSLQIAGLPDAAGSEVVRTRPDGVEIRFGTGDGGRLLSAAAIGVGNAVAKDIRLAEMLISRRATPDPAALADPRVNLKALLRG